MGKTIYEQILKLPDGNILYKNKKMIKSTQSNSYFNDEVSESDSDEEESIAEEDALIAELNRINKEQEEEVRFKTEQELKKIEKTRNPEILQKIFSPKVMMNHSLLNKVGMMMWYL